LPLHGAEACSKPPRRKAGNGYAAPLSRGKGHLFMVRPGGRLIPALAALLVMMTTVQGCSRQGEPPGHAAGSGDDTFRRLASEILEFTYKRDPSNATYLGIHKYDNIIRDYSSAGVKSDVETIKSFQGRLNDVDTGALSLDAQLDLGQTKHALEGM